jgi:hypothetical protein
MPAQLKNALRGLCLAFTFCVTVANAEDGAAWQVRKSSGEVWVSTSGVQPASLTQHTVLNPGDNIRTGRNGRVLLVRGEETILIAPNSVVGIPAAKQDGLPTSIIQQAGSILLDVEQRNVKHFEVQTPYLAAVVKGTQFRVTVGQFGSRVDVLRGKVEVADFKSGQFALVLPGQAARVSAQGNGGLTLSGSGTFNPIEKGTPRASSVTRVPVPRAGLTAPGRPAEGLRVLKLKDNVRSAMAGQVDDSRLQIGGNSHAPRITSAIGEVSLDFQKATKGLARDAAPAHARSTFSAKPSPQSTVWSSDSLTPGNGVGKAYNQGNGSGNGAASINASANGTATGNGNGAANGGGVALGQGNGNAFGLANAQAASSGNNGKGKGRN